MTSILLGKISFRIMALLLSGRMVWVAGENEVVAMLVWEYNILLKRMDLEVKNIWVSILASALPRSIGSHDVKPETYRIRRE